MLGARTAVAELRRRLASQAPGKGAPSRSFASDPHGEVKVNAWEAPTAVSKWKEEQIVIAVLCAWGVGIYGAMKVFGGKPAEAAPAKA